MKAGGRTASIALCGVLAALAICFMLLGGLIPFATFCCPVLASALLVPIAERCGRRLALVWYAAVSILCLLLAPDMEANLLFLFLGYYPILRVTLACRVKEPLQLPVKLIWFNAATILVYALMIFLFKLQAVMDEFYESGAWLLAALLVGGNLTFLLYDLLLERLTNLYYHRKHRR